MMRVRGYDMLTLNADEVPSNGWGCLILLFGGVFDVKFESVSVGDGFSLRICILFVILAPCGAVYAWSKKNLFVTRIFPFELLNNNVYINDVNDI